MSGGVIWSLYIFNALLFHVGGERTTLVNGGKGNRERENKGGGRVGVGYRGGSASKKMGSDFNSWISQYLQRLMLGQITAFSVSVSVSVSLRLSLSLFLLLLLLFLLNS